MSNMILIEKSAQGEAALQWKLPLNPNTGRQEFSATSLTWIKHQGRGTSQVPMTLASAIYFTTPAASVMSHSYTCLCTMATLSGYCLVVCDKFYKENASWQLAPLSLSTPIMSWWAECPCNSKSCRSSPSSDLPSISSSLFLSFPSLALVSRAGSWMLCKVLHTY